MKSIHSALLSLSMIAVSLAQVPDQAGAEVPRGAEAEILKFEEGFSSALARNDVDALQHYLSEDWSIVSGDGQVITRARFLGVIASGDLKHDKMSFHRPTIRLYGETALATSHTNSGGTYKGVEFHTDEIGTDVIVKIHGRWVCVLTQLTTVAQK
jgi:ketosteroid isomerase-like protein